MDIPIKQELVFVDATYENEQNSQPGTSNSFPLPTVNEKLGQRSKNFSEQNKNKLITIAAKYGQILESKISDTNMWSQKKSAWQMITAEYNCGEAYVRNTDQLKKKYENLKKDVKAKLARQNGGGPLENGELTEAEEKMIGLLHDNGRGLYPVYDPDEVTDEVGASPSPPEHTWEKYTQSDVRRPVHPALLSCALRDDTEYLDEDEDNVVKLAKTPNRIVASELISTPCKRLESSALETVTNNEPQNKIAANAKEHYVQPSTSDSFLLPMLKEEQELDCEGGAYDFSLADSAWDESAQYKCEQPCAPAGCTVKPLNSGGVSSKAVPSTSGFSNPNLETPSNPQECFCDTCGKTFDRKILLLRHMSQSHGKKRQYSCINCKMSFAKKRQLTLHLRIHCGDRHLYCVECNKKFSRKGNLTLHLRTHSGEKRFSCAECKKSFYQKHTLALHTRVHSEERPFPCTECKKSFKQKGALKKHSMIHSGERPHSCTECQKRFRTSNELIIHSMIHSGERPYSCPECSKSFKLIGELTSHSRVHSEKKPFSCTECQKCFKTKNEMAMHHLRIHSEEKPFSCTECPKRFKSNGDLTLHSRVHSREKPYPCTECQKRFRTSGYLKMHLLIHSGQKAYSCVECKKNFRCKKQLTIHSMIHSGEKPFCCAECHKCFKTKGELKLHSVVHSTERPYSCRECKKSFKTKSELTLHSKIHSGVKPFFCVECKKSFRRAIQLKIHSKIHSDKKSVLSGKTLQEGEQPNNPVKN